MMNVVLVVVDKRLKRKFRTFPTKMSLISWFKCSECQTKWHEFVNVKDTERPCRGTNCKKTVKAYTTRGKALGYFECTKCVRKWTSSYTYPNTFQKCICCKINLLPYKMDPLELSGEEDRDAMKIHVQRLCGRCIQLGRRCTDLPTYVDDATNVILIE